MAKVILIGLEPSIALQVCHVLERNMHLVQQKSEIFKLEDVKRADIVFASGTGKQYLSMISRIHGMRPGLPVVVVTSSPQASEWLDALEAGASDYCSAPFESRQIEWIVESALRRSQALAAA